MTSKVEQAPTAETLADVCFRLDAIDMGLNGITEHQPEFVQLRIKEMRHQLAYAIKQLKPSVDAHVGHSEERNGKAE